ncbi:MAG: hypothetical protein LWW86_12745 [Micrococcales bacterium]|nr:hypothetical protein [Micrococcales bacterium]
MTAALRTRVALRDGEDITAFLQRTCAANFTTIEDVTGYRASARVWEDPPPDLLVRVAAVTGITTEQLRAATLLGAFPGVPPARARIGRRWAGETATCTGCGIQTVAARLNVIVLCPLCRSPLTDRQPSPAAPVPTGIGPIHDEVMDTLAAAAQDRHARDRLRRLESLMAEFEPALWRNWPPLAEGETQTWRDWIVRWHVHQRAISGYLVRPPEVSLTSLLHTWAASADPERTRRYLDEFALAADRWQPTQRERPGWDTLEQAVPGLQRKLRRLKLHPHHVPTILRRPGESIILPEHLRTRRTAEALALTLHAGLAHHLIDSLHAAERVHGTQASPRARRVARLILASPFDLGVLAVQASTLHAAGLQDRHRLRGALAGLDKTPTSLTRQLHAAAAAFPDVQILAAAWVWLDATAGRLAGGAHPQLAPATVLAFDDTLDGHDRDLLRAWWHTHTNTLNRPPRGVARAGS